MLKHNVGDKVIITKEASHRFKVGDSVTINRKFYDGEEAIEHYGANSDTRGHWYIDDTECEALPEPNKRYSMEWINERHKKPPYDQYVLCYCRIHGIFLGSYFQIEGFNSGNWQRGTEQGILPPTYWMPLPEPPKQ